MVEGNSLPKKDEQFPLLMVAGAGDGGPRNPAAPSVDSLWTTTTAIPRKRFWSERWPEYLSTCWMTFILLGISFLVFYAIGMIVVYNNDAYILLKCNGTRPASEVFYHHIMPRGGKFPFTKYTNYLGNIALQYPQLRFKVYFLIDDSKDILPIEINFYEKIYNRGINDEYPVHSRREVREFTAKYPNVKITVMYLSRYMAMTPLQYIWKFIPISYIPFYAKIYSVWLNGGVGLDLDLSNELYNSGSPKHIDPKISAILKQHNDGISPEKYVNTLKKLAREEEFEYMYFFYNMMQKMINETLSMFSQFHVFYNTDIDDSNVPKPEAISHPGNLKRCRRVQRDVVDQEINSTSAPQTNVVNIVISNTSLINVTGGENKENMYHILENNSSVPTDAVNKSKSKTALPVSEAGWVGHIFGDNNFDDIVKPLFNRDSDKNKSDGSQIILFYDISVLSEPVHPEDSLHSESLETRRIKKSERSINVNSRNNSVLARYVVVDAYGSFVASTTNKHPFLAHVLSAGYKSLHPKMAIENAITAHCSGPLRNDHFCNSIYVL